MGNTTSNAGAGVPQGRRVHSPGRQSASPARRTDSPAGRAKSPLGPHRSLRQKKKSLELPDLASLALTPSHSGASTPHRRGVRTSSPIPIPVSATQNPSSVAPRPQLPSTTEMAEVLYQPPSTHIPIAHPGYRPRSQHIRGAPLPYNSTRSFSGRSSQVPPAAARRADSNEFVPEVIRSSIPVVLRDKDDDHDADGQGHVRRRTKDDEPVPVKIVWRGGAERSVVLARAGDDNWKGRQPLERDPATDEWSATINLLPGTHHIKFIVDDQWRTADDMPTATTDDDGSLANYLAVAAPSSPPSPAHHGLALRTDPAHAKHLNGGISFWSGDDTESVSSYDGNDGGVRIRDGMWTDEFPPALIAAAREEEAYLAAQDATDDASYDYSPNTARMPAPNVPPAPALPRFLEKLILNVRQDPPAGRSSREREQRRESRRKGRASNMSSSNVSENAEPMPSPTPIPVTTASGTDVTKVHGLTITPTLPSTAEETGHKPHSRSRGQSIREAPAQVQQVQTLSDDASVLPVPSHVVLHHLSTSAIKNGVLAVANTTRYRRKYLTTIYYKPT
ncbi:hypothetical protein PUNSTDRAFT_141436 [Punctularia strigosozonata HHB-11173 SS5]|uniref:uncharacterized protein n=1 Tax=Punctularia strigosozonata (strain HHB-11173) TaxID=741275 RepID=UPI0004416B0A|nr:uncharacterized protein PUNSTDRAFT_141436 [Punctularia strigosozonata HHB-11173 SS5]EIN12854.1 hypothetical protein PUNSTDRAFT_141436 [Punctularia strigosozonata HHB-11173 SS5]